MFKITQSALSKILRVYGYAYSLKIDYNSTDKLVFKYLATPKTNNNFFVYHCNETFQKGRDMNALFYYSYSDKEIMGCCQEFHNILMKIKHGKHV